MNLAEKFKSISEVFDIEKMIKDAPRDEIMKASQLKDKKEFNTFMDALIDFAVNHGPIYKNWVDAFRDMALSFDIKMKDGKMDPKDIKARVLV